MKTEQVITKSLTYIRAINSAKSDLLKVNRKNFFKIPVRKKQYARDNKTRSIGVACALLKNDLEWHGCMTNLQTKPSSPSEKIEMRSKNANLLYTQRHSSENISSKKCYARILKEPTDTNLAYKLVEEWWLNA